MNKREKFRKLALGWLHCERCILCETRKNVVFARGSFDPLVLFVGEAPGADEDETGKPFVGRSGRLLDELIEESGIGSMPHAIVNVIGCRPPGNREPTIFESMACKRRLEELLDILEPKVLVVLGRTAARKISGIQAISRWRGAVIDSDMVVLNKVRVYKTVITYHPSYLLRSGKDGHLREMVLSDFYKAKKEADEYREFETGEDV